MSTRGRNHRQGAVGLRIRGVERADPLARVTTQPTTRVGTVGVPSVHTSFDGRERKLPTVWRCHLDNKPHAIPSPPVTSRTPTSVRRLKTTIRRVRSRTTSRSRVPTATPATAGTTAATDPAATAVLG